MPITNPFFPDLVKSIQEKALALGYDVVVLNTNYESKRDSPYVQRLLALPPLLASWSLARRDRIRHEARKRRVRRGLPHLGRLAE